MMGINQMTLVSRPSSSFSPIACFQLRSGCMRALYFMAYAVCSLHGRIARVFGAWRQCPKKRRPHNSPPLTKLGVYAQFDRG